MKISCIHFVFVVPVLLCVSIAVARGRDCNDNGIADTLDLVGAIYWTDGTRIRRVHLDGTGVQDIVTNGVTSPRGIALDAAAGKVYWTDATAKKIQRSDLDGRNIEDLISNASTGYVPVGIALHVATGQMYWGNEEFVGRSNLDGTLPEPVTGVGLVIQDLALDLSAGHLYFTDTLNPGILRVGLNGGGATAPISTGSLYPAGLALDSIAGKIYWTHPSTHKIQRANLDGTEIDDLVNSGLETPVGIALDIPAGRMYWADQGTGKIQRAGLDGSNVIEIASVEFTAPPYIALIPRTDDPDSDGDGVLDECDECPNDPDKVTAGVCGCGAADSDRDGDGALDCLDGCPDDSDKLYPGLCGCGAADDYVDSDHDFVFDCIDDDVSNPVSGDPMIGDVVPDMAPVCGGGLPTASPLLLIGLLGFRRRMRRNVSEFGVNA